MRAHTLLSVLLVFAASLPARTAPRVAVVYSAWSDNSFVEEWDDELGELGWVFEKFENVNIADLVGRLGEFDVVIAASVANYENAQDMAPFREQWLGFLRGGGCLLITDANYATALNQWVNTFGEEFALSSAKCAAHTEATEESRAIGVADHPLMTVPNELALLFRRNLNAWAHLETWPEGWQSLVTCADEKSLFLTKRVGKGLLAVTSYYSFKGESRREAGVPLLENLWLYVQHLQRGVEVRRLDFGPMVPGPGSAKLRLRNAAEGELRLRVRVEVESDGREPQVGTAAGTTIPPGEEAAVDVPFRIASRGALSVRLVGWRADGERVLDFTRGVDIPPPVRLKLKRKHLYPRQPNLEATIRLLPEADVDRETLRLRVRVDEGEERDERVEGDTAEPVAVSLPTGDLPNGEHSLHARLLSEGRELGQATTQFIRHPEPRFALREDGVTLLEGKPFFPFGFYHVSPYFDADHRLNMARNLAAAGFNCTHTRITEFEPYRRFLDECAKLGVYVVTEFTAPMFETVERFRDHPAVLGWNPGDEPSIHGTTPDMMFSRYDRFKQLDPDHLVYTTICRPGEYANYARGTDVLAPDPYPIPNRPVSEVYRSLKAAGTEASQFDTTLWGVLQCFGGYGGWTRPPTAKELRAMTYLALLAGVKGILYYTYGDGKWVVIDHPVQWEAAKALVPEIKRLAPVVMDGELTILSESDDVFAGMWEHEGDRYVVIVNADDEERSFDLPVEGAAFELPFRAERLQSLKLGDGKLAGTVEGVGTLVLHLE